MGERVGSIDSGNTSGGTGNLERDKTFTGNVITFLDAGNPSGNEEGGATAEAGGADSSSSATGGWRTGNPGWNGAGNYPPRLLLGEAARLKDFLDAGTPTNPAASGLGTNGTVSGGGNGLPGAADSPDGFQTRNVGGSASGQMAAGQAPVVRGAAPAGARGTLE